MIRYFNKLGFHKIEGKYCYQKNYHKEHDFSTAKEKCAFDSDCLGFYHGACKRPRSKSGYQFRLCKKSLVIKDSKMFESCLYVKGNFLYKSSSIENKLLKKS